MLLRDQQAVSVAVAKHGYIDRGLSLRVNVTQKLRRFEFWG
jgi:hypothetical protein